MDGESKKVVTKIGNVTNAALNIASDHGHAEVTIDQHSELQPVDAIADELLTYIKDSLNSDITKMIEEMVKQATEESKKDTKDTSKINGILGMLKPVLKGASLVPKALEAFDEWSHLLGV